VTGSTKAVGFNETQQPGSLEQHELISDTPRSNGSLYLKMDDYDFLRDIMRLTIDAIANSIARSCLHK